MFTDGIEQAIQRLADGAASLTLDQRLRIAAFLARPAGLEPATPSPTGALLGEVTAESLVLTVEDVAELLKVGRTTVYDLIKTGQLDSILIGRLRRIHRTEVVDYLDRIGKATSLDETRDR